MDATAGLELSFSRDEIWDWWRQCGNMVSFSYWWLLDMPLQAIFSPISFSCNCGMLFTVEQAFPWKMPQKSTWALSIASCNWRGPKLCGVIIRQASTDPDKHEVLHTQKWYKKSYVNSFKKIVILEWGGGNHNSLIFRILECFFCTWSLRQYSTPALYTQQVNLTWPHCLWIKWSIFHTEGTTSWTITSFGQLN